MSTIRRAYERERDQHQQTCELLEDVAVELEETRQALYGTAELLGFALTWLGLGDVAELDHVRCCPECEAAVRARVSDPVFCLPFLASFRIIDTRPLEIPVAARSDPVWFWAAQARNLIRPR